MNVTIEPRLSKNLEWSLQDGQYCIVWTHVHELRGEKSAIQYAGQGDTIGEALERLLTQVSRAGYTWGQDDTQRLVWARFEGVLKELIFTRQITAMMDGRKIEYP